MNRETVGNIGGIPHLAKNERDTRISCTRHQTTAKCAASIEQSRMSLIGTNKLHRKSVGMGHPGLWQGEISQFGTGVTAETHVGTRKRGIPYILRAVLAPPSEL